MMMAAKSVAGVFVACFTPPETTSSKNYGDNDDFRAPSGEYLTFFGQTMVEIGRNLVDQKTSLCVFVL